LGNSLSFLLARARNQAHAKWLWFLLSASAFSRRNCNRDINSYCLKQTGAIAGLRPTIVQDWSF
jgi:hypothetical protein